ncbi:hypothetical protein OLMES_5159 [Oleiphilus messinensis]|uniref:Penicillin-binding protein activator LpoB n=1 Tax=Oleiphilus messinensis TaxID=141451 RepID=A0A1Y0II89_9GAMM|nr:hypothetical protein [Oleiphilus messinensis]ARU59143.1 hypothetical protein OLMES_5159 [Oleiphilus messinensis]
MNKHIQSSVFVVSLGFALVACQANPPKQPSSSRVSIVDSKERVHHQTKLTTADYVALSETVTNKMLVSSLVRKWGGDKPKLIAAIPLNNTDNEGIRMKDLHDRITETILSSEVAAIVDQSATNFDYIIKSELTSTRQYGEEGKELVYYTLQLKMFTLMGELVGQWSDDLALAKARKSWY